MEFTFTAPLEQRDSSLGWHFVVFIPEALIPQLGNEKTPRVKAIFNEIEVCHISVKSSGTERFLVVNSELRKKLSLSEGSQVKVKIEEETSKYGMPMPEELSLMLAEDEEGDAHFHNLTPGKQRTLIYMVSKLKNVDARIRKALGIVEHLVEVRGELDYKALNEKFKEINQRAKLRF